MDQSVLASARADRAPPAPPPDSVAPGRTTETRPHDLLEVRSPRPAATPEKGGSGSPRPVARKEAGSDENGASDTDTSEDTSAKDGRSDSKDKATPPRFAALRKHPFLAIGAAVLLIAAIVAGILWYLEARHYESSDDAFIDARQFSVAPKVSGYVTEVHVTDNQSVRQGDVMFRIDPRDYRIAVDQAQAALEQAQAQIGNIDAQIESQKAQVDVAQAQIEQADYALVLARQEEARAADLVTKGAGTLQNEQQRRSALQQAQADLVRTKAALVSAQRQVGSLLAQRKSAEANRDSAGTQVEQAKLNLGYTDMLAPQAGRIARLTGAVGQYVQTGQAITMFVPDRLWVTSNFKETQITDMRPGQKVTLSIDAYPDRKIEGHVDSIQAGSGTAFSLLPAENATGNYVKVVQRIPVKIAFDSVPDDVTLGPGMSVVPRVRVR